MKKSLEKMFSVFIATTMVLTNVTTINAEPHDNVNFTKEKNTDYEIYPVPHSKHYTDGEFTITSDVNIVYEDEVDIYTKNHLQAILENKDINFTMSDEIVEEKTNLLLGVKDSEGYVDTYFDTNILYDEDFFGKTDSHIINVEDGVIAVLGNHTDSTFYGVTTLKHIFNQIDMEIKNLRIDDYADVASRGFIEGYYGNPWSNEDRAELMIYGGDYKMNQYIFAPKNDPYHNSKWRELYPEEDLQGVKELAKVGNQTKNRYVYALHPFMYDAMRFNTDEAYQEDFDIITAKFTQLLEADVRQFAILADDAGVPDGNPANYTRLLADLTVWLREQQEIYPDLKDDIVFCPNDYMGWGTSEQLREVNKAGDNVDIVMTGGRIWGEVDQNFTSSFMSNIATEGYPGRAPYLWINWPCSDNSKEHLIMGGNTTFLHPGVDPETIAGIVLNPMQQAEANKSGLFANADYAWNIWDTEEDGEQNWHDSFKYMDHGTAEETESSTALREISKHMINQDMDSRVDVLHESLELSPKLNAFKEKYSTGAKVADDAKALIEEFTALKDYAAYYEENPGNSRTRDQIIYWLNCWEDTTNAAIEYLSAVIATEEGTSSEVWAHFSNGQAAFEQSKTYKFWYIDHYQKAEVGVQHIVPFIETLGEELSNIVAGIVDPDKVIPKFITNRTDKPTGNTSNVLDGNSLTEIVFQNPNSIEVGTYVGVTFNTDIQLKDVQFLMGTAANPNDTMQAGKIQYTVDGQEWIDLNDEIYNMPKDVSVDGLNLTVRGVRFIATTEKTNTWLGVKDIIVNKNSASEDDNNDDLTLKLIRTSEWGVYSGNESALFDGSDSTNVWYSTPSDITKVGDFIGVDLGEIIKVGEVHFAVGAGDGDKWTDYDLEYSTDDSTWTKFAEYREKGNGTDIIDVDFEGIEARYVRIVNKKELNKWVKFSEISVSRFVEGNTKNIYTNTEVGIKSLETDSLTQLLPQNNITLNEGEYIGVKLERIRDLSDIRVEISNMEGLTLESSINGVEWDVVDNNNLLDARYVRVIASETVTFDVEKFEVESTEFYPGSLIESYAAPYGGVDAGVALDGDVNTSVKFGNAPSAGNEIVYDLGQVINVKNLKYVVLDTELDHIRDAKIQLSLDGENWTDAIVIGDGINDTNTFDNKPADNGYTHGSLSNGLIPISHSYMDSDAIDIDAKYLRVLFTANNGGRWAVINEMLINDGAYIPEVNDPTFESDPIELRGFGPSNLQDGNLTTSYKPNTNNGEITSGSIVYKLSEKLDVKKINIVQSGSVISNAKVMVRTGLTEDGEPVWNQIGVLDESLTEILNTEYDNIFEIKIVWEDIAPNIYELITINEYELPVKDELQAKYDELVDLNAEDYTVKSFATLTEALEAAAIVLADNNSTQIEIDSALTALIAAEVGLEEKTANGNELKELIDSCDYEEENYTVSSWLVYADALKTANEVLDDLANKTQEEVDLAKEALKAAISELTLRAINLEDLENAIIEADKVTEAQLEALTAEERAMFENAKEIAKATLANSNDMTQEEVNKAFSELVEAMKPLFTGDKTRLIALVEKINGLNSKEYILSTWEALESVVAEANSVIENENATEAEIDNMYSKVLVSYLGLRLKPSKEKLEGLINSVLELDSKSYTSRSWALVSEKLEAAKVVMNDENATDEEVKEVVSELEDAVDELVDTTALSELIEEAGKISTDAYIESVVTKFKEAIEASELLLANKEATLEDINSSIEVLKSAIKNLEGNEKIDIESVKTTIQLAKEALENGNYTDESVKALNDAIEKAEELILDGNSTLLDGKEIQDAIVFAMESLEAKVETEKPETEEPETEKPESEKPETNEPQVDEEDKENLPQTGGASALVITIIGSLVVGAGGMLNKKKK